MFYSMGRFVRCQKSVRPLVRWKATRHQKVADITDARFWEDETRPIPNVSDSVVHVVTQDNQHINWERSLHKVKLMGVVETAASWIKVGGGGALHFELNTTSIIEETDGYLIQRNVHHILIMQETIRMLALRNLKRGVAVIVIGAVHYRIHSPFVGVSSVVLPHIYLEQFEILASRDFTNPKPLSASSNFLL